MAGLIAVFTLVLIGVALVGIPVFIFVALIRRRRSVPAVWMDYEANTILLEPFALDRGIEELPLRVVWPVENDRGKISGEIVILVRGVSEEVDLLPAQDDWYYLDRGAEAAMDHLAEWPTEMSERVALGKAIYARDLVREGGEGRDEIRPPLHPNEIYNAMEGSWIDNLEDKSLQQDRLKSLASTVLWSVGLMVLGIIFVTLFRGA